MSAYSETARLMPNVPLTYISVCERMQAYEHIPLAYADAIRCSVTALLDRSVYYAHDVYFITGNVYTNK